MIDITIKTLDSRNHEFSVQDDLTVKQLKEQIAESVSVPAESQRLIYCGRVLLDDKKLSEYDVNGKVIHLVQRAPPSSGGGSSSTSGTASGRSGDRVGSRGRLDNAMYLGAMAFPADLMEAQGLTVPPARHTLSHSRLGVARAMLRRANTVLQALEGRPDQPSDQTSTSDPSTPVESSTPAEPAQEINIQAEVNLTADSSPTDQRPDQIAQATAEAVSAALGHALSVHHAGVNLAPESAPASAAESGQVPRRDQIAAAAAQAVSAAFGQALSSHRVNLVPEATPTPAPEPTNTVPRPDQIAAAAAEAVSAALGHALSVHHGGNVSITLNNGDGTGPDDLVVRVTQGTGSGPGMGGGLLQPRPRPTTQRTTALADLVSQVRDVQRRMEPFLDRYYNLMHNDPPDASENQMVFNQVSELMHLLAHAYHSLSDIMCDLSQPPPRVLRCRPVLIQHSAVLQTGIPIQVPASAQIINLTTPSSNNSQMESGSQNEGQTNSAQPQNRSEEIPRSTESQPQPPPESQPQGNVRPEDILVGGVGPRGERASASGTVPTATVSISPSNLEIFMDVSSGSITLDSVEVLSSAHSANNPPASEQPANQGGAIGEPNPWGPTPPNDFLQHFFHRIYGEMSNIHNNNYNNNNNNSSGGNAGTGSAPNGRPQSASATGTTTGPANGGISSFINGGVTNAAASGGVTNAAASGGVTNAAASGGVTNAAVSGGVTNAAASGGVTNAATSAGVTNAASAGMTNAASAGVTNAASAGNTSATSNGSRIEREGEVSSSQPHLGTGSTHPRATFSRPHIHIGAGPHIQTMDFFDPFLPCNSHHIRGVRRRAAGSSNTSSTADQQQQNSESTANPSASEQTASGSSGPAHPTVQMTLLPSVPSRTRSIVHHIIRMLPQDIVRNLQAVNGGSGSIMRSTVSQLLEALPGHTYTPGRSLIMDFFMTAGRNVMLQDVMYDASPAMLGWMRPGLREYLENSLGVDSSCPDAAIEAAVKRINKELTSFFRSPFEGLTMREDVDLPASIRKVSQAFLPQLIKDIHQADNFTYSMNVSQQVVKFIRGLISVLAYASQTSRSNIDSVILAFACKLANGHTAEVKTWIVGEVVARLQQVIRPFDLTRDTTRQFIVNVPPPQANTQPMEVDGVEEASSPEVVSSPLREREPLPNIIIGSEPWHHELPADWVPIITRDRERQRRGANQGPLSDAYLAGMPSKRRKLLTDAKPNSTLNKVISESMGRALGAAGLAPSAAADLVEAAACDTNLRDAYKAQVRSSVESTLRSHPDYHPDKYPNTAKYFNRLHR